MCTKRRQEQEHHKQVCCTRVQDTPNNPTKTSRTAVNSGPRTDCECLRHRQVVEEKDAHNDGEPRHTDGIENVVRSGGL